MPSLTPTTALAETIRNVSLDDDPLHHRGDGTNGAKLTGYVGAAKQHVLCRMMPMAGRRAAGWSYSAARAGSDAADTVCRCEASSM